MQGNESPELDSQFQHAFARLFEDQIQQLIQDSRREALAQAKEILRENALNNVLQAVIGIDDKKEQSDDDVAEFSVRPLEKSTKSQNKANTGGKPAKASHLKDATNVPPVLNDRILEEIEAIREQIRRNELLLSQIKPFVQTSKVQEE